MVMGGFGVHFVNVWASFMGGLKRNGYNTHNLSKGFKFDHLGVNHTSSFLVKSATGTGQTGTGTGDFWSNQQLELVKKYCVLLYGRNQRGRSIAESIAS